jgi:hypothetical protein
VSRARPSAARYVSVMLGRITVGLCAIVLGSCSSGAPLDTTCGSATIGPSGGAVLATNGATLVVPRGALSTETEVTLCSLGAFAPRRDQLSDLIVVRPTSLALAMPASFTIPIRSETLSDGRVEIGQSVDDDAPVVLTAVRSGSDSASFEHDHFGYVRVFGTPSAPHDAGVDGSRDAARGDAGPLPLAPVVVGIDLDPADYSCMGTRVVPDSGDMVAVELRLIDWEDGLFRASYQFRALASPPTPDTMFDCFSTPDCTTTDATGHASLMLPAGPIWIDVLSFDPSGTFTDDRHQPARNVHLPVIVPPGGGAIDVETISARTAASVGVTTGTHFGQVTMGRVLDCNGDLVQRARIRAFDDRTRSELFDAGDGLLYTYGTTSGIPIGGRDRTGADGTFLVDVRDDPSRSIRLEAWGQLVAGGPEVMLSCELRRVTTLSFVGVTVIGDLLPAAANRSTTCSE